MKVKGIQQCVAHPIRPGQIRTTIADLSTVLYICSMIKRELSNIIMGLRDKYPVISLTGPRQSGKTTLLKSIYTDLPYVNLENIDIRNNALEDPRGFLSNFPTGAVIDEAQRAPDLFSYIQVLVDENKNMHFVLSGSQNFLLLQSITQSLAGRAAILKLLPFNLSELSNDGISFSEYEEVIFNGLFPAIYDKDLDPSPYYSSYTATYLERDVRLIKNIENLSSFSTFLKLCAGRIGQVLNLNSLATDAGISPNTAKSWLSILEASYILYYLSPFHNNFNKRIIKSPKLYFFDTGLACSLLGIQTKQQVQTYYGKGTLFENLVINEFLKNSLNKGNLPRLYYWQNKTKKEIDLIIDTLSQPIPCEIKSGRTMNMSFLANLKYWQKLTNGDPRYMNVIYGGDDGFITSFGNFVSWKNLQKIFESL